MDAGALPPAVRHFNPRPPRGGRRRQIPPPRQSTDFNPRPPRGGRRQIKKEGSRTAAISIHAPREGGDRSPAHPDGQKRDFNPRPPRGGRRRHICSAMSYSRFQSTPPARGATRHPLAATRGNFLFQSTPPARGATTTRPVSDIARRISIHAPREGGDGQDGVRCNPIGISIHAPREGGDSKDAQFYLRIFDKQVELLRFLGKIRGGCLRNPEKGRRFLGKSLANLPEIAGHLDFAGGGKAHPGYPCAVPLPRRAACVRGSGDPPADRCSSYRNAPLFSHIASPDSKSADCLSQNP